jgi:hypothetical protein
VKKEIELLIVKRTDLDLLKEMSRHYSQPKGFVGRNICYAVVCGGIKYGHIVGGSATKHLSGRNEFIGYDVKDKLNNIINNIFFHVEPVNGTYPFRNFTTQIIKNFEIRVQKDWFYKYNDEVIAFETLVEPPRTGECYRRAGWKEVGMTKGYTCKRVAGNGNEKWTGKRVWDTENLRPKKVFVKLSNVRIDI